MQARARGRNRGQERRERLRYRLLERIYLLTGGKGWTELVAGELDDGQGSSGAATPDLLDELERLGYVEHVRDGSTVRITGPGIEFLARDAWRRQSVR